MRIGHGFDMHKFGGCNPLVIGGVVIPNERGLLAHSDGDVMFCYYRCFSWCCCIR